MNDRDFLMWLHERLEYVHKEKDLYDFMHKLRAIIASTDKDKNSKSSCTNSLESLKKKL